MITEYKRYDTKSHGERILYKCLNCSELFSETSNSFMFQVKKPISLISSVLNSRTEGLGFNATCRNFSISSNTLRSWESKIGSATDVLKLYSLTHTFLSQIIEGDELYTRVHENKPQEESEGWTIMFIERASRFIWEFECGKKDKALFTGVLERLAELIKRTEEFTLVTDGERRYGNILFDLCQEVINTAPEETPMTVLKKGILVGLKNKGKKKPSKMPKYERPQPEHPETTHVLEDHDIHANHAEGQNAATRRKLSPFRRRTNTYAKTKTALQRVLDLYWVVHNFIRKHYSTKTVPAVANGILKKGLVWSDVLTMRLAL